MFQINIMLIGGDISDGMHSGGKPPPDAADATTHSHLQPGQPQGPHSGVSTNGTDVAVPASGPLLPTNPSDVRPDAFLFALEILCFMLLALILVRRCLMNRLVWNRMGGEEGSAGTVGRGSGFGTSMGQFLQRRGLMGGAMGGAVPGSREADRATILQMHQALQRGDLRGMLQRLARGGAVDGGGILSDDGQEGANEMDIARLPLQTFRPRSRGGSEIGTASDEGCGVGKPGLGQGTGVSSAAPSRPDEESGEGTPSSEGDPSLTCAICLCDFEAGDSLRTMPCLHMLHKDCVDRWLRQNASCPVCKHSVLDM
jgi:hypothetical protein